MRKIIAFTGSKQSGKSTASKVLSNMCDDVHEIMFARKLKEVCSEIFNIDMSIFEDGILKEKDMEDPICLTHYELEWIIKEFGYECDFNNHVRQFMNKVLYTPRELLQFIGTEVLHNVDKDIHIKTAIKNLPKDGVIVITDLRFEREFNYLKDNFKDEFLPFYIKNTKAELIAEDDQHKSEKDLQKFKNKCTLIENNFTLQEYEDKLKTALRSIL